MSGQPSVQTRRRWGCAQRRRNTECRRAARAGGYNSGSSRPRPQKLWVDKGTLTDPVTGVLVGDNLGGGNPVVAQSVSRTDDGRFAVIRDGAVPATCPNFQAGRAVYFRYGLSARHGVFDPDLVEDGAAMGSCDNGIDDADVAGDPGDCANPSDGKDGLGDGSFTCADGIDNGADGADRRDPSPRLVAPRSRVPRFDA